MSSFEYPNNIRHTDQIEEVNYHGTIVQEKYKWLEDPHSEEVKVSYINFINIFKKILTVFV